MTSLSKGGLGAPAPPKSAKKPGYAFGSNKPKPKKTPPGYAAWKRERAREKAEEEARKAHEEEEVLKTSNSKSDIVIPVRF